MALVLVVEDEAGIRDNLARLLRLEGYQVLLAANGREALTLLHAAPQTMPSPPMPDLVLTDMMMPELNGRQLLRALRSDPRTAALPVVLLTARADGSDVQDGLADGASDYITKPYQRDVLLACLRRQLVAPP